jgi:hypothetical protein
MFNRYATKSRRVSTVSPQNQSLIRICHVERDEPSDVGRLVGGQDCWIGDTRSYPEYVGSGRLVESSRCHRKSPKSQPNCLSRRIIYRLFQNGLKLGVLEFFNEYVQLLCDEVQKSQHSLVSKPKSHPCLPCGKRRTKRRGTIGWRTRLLDWRH